MSRHGKREERERRRNSEKHFSRGVLKSQIEGLDHEREETRAQGPAENTPAREEESPATETGREETTKAGAEIPEEKQLTQIGARFVLLKKKFSEQIAGTAEEKLGLLLDEVRAWANMHAENLLSVWDRISRADSDGEAAALLREKAVKLAAEFVDFLEGENDLAGLELDSRQKALVKRVAALHYAGALWSAGDVSAEERERALWFLLKTGALRITHSEPEGSRSIRVSRKTWLEFPHVLLYAPTSDGRAAEASGLLEKDTVNCFVKHITADFEGYNESHTHDEGEVTFSSPTEARKSLRSGKFILPVRPVYLERKNIYIGGGFFLVFVTGSDDMGYSLRILDVVDAPLLSVLEDAVGRNGTRIGTRLVSLSENINSIVPVRLAGGEMDIPLCVFSDEKLQSREVDHRDLPRAMSDDEDLYRTANLLSRILKSAFISALFPLKRGKNGQTSADGDGKKTKSVAPVVEEKPSNAAPSKSPKSHRKLTTEVKIGEEERRGVEAALSECSKEYALPILSQAEFLDHKQPSGCAFVALFGYLKLFAEEGICIKDSCFVVFRRAEGEKIAVYRYPESLQGVLGSGAYNGLVISKLLDERGWAKKYSPLGAVAATAKEKEEVSASTGQPAEGPAAEPVFLGGIVPEPQEEPPVEEKIVFPAPLAGTLGPAAPPPQKPKRREKKPKAEPVNTWASPQAEALAKKHGIAREEITGSGKGGSVTKADVEAHCRQ